MQLSIVVPCYNEQEALPMSIPILISLMESLVREEIISNNSEILFVDDGSSDATWSIIKEMSGSLPYVRGIKLSRNFGHQIALLAGLNCTQSDITITIDVDLQDDVCAIRDMIISAQGGADIVYGVRKSRSVDTRFKQITAEIYYRLLSLLGVEIVFNHADYRLMSRRAVDALLQYKEVNIFLRGIVPHIGFNTSIVYYDRNERIAGETKYPLRKMLSLAWQGVTSFSIAPLRAIIFLGFILSIVSVSMAIWAIIMKIFSHETIPGWTSTVVPVCLIGGVQLFCTGLTGEYLGKIYLEVKNRPRYFVSDETLVKK